MRLSTAGRDVWDGIGLGVSEAGIVAVGVSVGVSVGVTEAVCEAVDAGKVAVFVGRLVSTNVGGIGVDVKVQENEVMINRSEKTTFRRMSEIYSLFR